MLFSYRLVLWLIRLCRFCLTLLAGTPPATSTPATTTSRLTLGRLIFFFYISSRRFSFSHLLWFTALLFGLCDAAQLRLQGTATQVPYEVFLALPYVVTLIVLALATQRLRMPAADGMRWRKGQVE